MASDNDILDELAGSIKQTVIATCAKVADIHRISRPENTFQEGYNKACADIAAKIRELGKANT